MSKEEFIKAMVFLSRSFGKDMTKDQLDVWYSFFQNEEETTFRKAIKIIAEQQNFFPSIAQIKEEIKKLTEEDYSTNAKNEWGLVLEAMRKTGYYKQDEFREMLKPKTLKVCERMGIEHLMIMESEEKPSMQKLFFNLYEGITEYEKNQKVYEENIKRLNELKQDFLIKGVK